MSASTWATAQSLLDWQRHPTTGRLANDRRTKKGEKMNGKKEANWKCSSCACFQGTVPRRRLTVVPILAERPAVGANPPKANHLGVSASWGTGRLDVAGVRWATGAPHRIISDSWRKDGALCFHGPGTGCNGHVRFRFLAALIGRRLFGADGPSGRRT